MIDENEIYVVGVYEDFRLDVFPTHACPIVAEHSPRGYRRWQYRIESPYRIRLLEPIGTFHSSIETLFPVFTYHACRPQRLSEDSQVIALSRDDIIVETAPILITIKLIIASFGNFRSVPYWLRAITTLGNSFRKTR